MESKSHLVFHRSLLTRCRPANERWERKWPWEATTQPRRIRNNGRSSGLLGPAEATGLFSAGQWALSSACTRERHISSVNDVFDRIGCECVNQIVGALCISFVSEMACFWKAVIPHPCRNQRAVDRKEWRPQGRLGTSRENSGRRSCPDETPPRRCCWRMSSENWWGCRWWTWRPLWLQ